ncbi:hypothetical protein FKM82_030604 [Ascaphus truei]
MQSAPASSSYLTSSCKRPPARQPVRPGIPRSPAPRKRTSRNFQPGTPRTTRTAGLAARRRRRSLARRPIQEPGAGAWRGEEGPAQGRGRRSGSLARGWGKEWGLW